LRKISLLAYLKKEQKLNNYWYDCLRYELDKHIYYYGNHFKRPLEKVQTSNLEKLKYNLKLIYLSIIQKFLKKNIDKFKPVIISNAYFNFNDAVSKEGFTIIQPPWSNYYNDWKFYNAGLVKLCFKIKKQFGFKDFDYLLSNEFMQLLEEFSDKFKEFIVRERIAALIVPNDESFFENISIKIFKELKLSTFIFLHGFTAQFNGIDDYRSDFLIVWGKRSKELYINHGMDEKKVFVSGHPTYQKVSKSTLKFSLSDVLILTKAVPGSPHSTGTNLYDRGNLITYLFSVQKVLKSFNVKTARLRPHPSENIDWYMQFLDKKFFIPDIDNLTQSLNKTSLVIGPISSVFIDALYRETNYLVYEPSNGNTSITNHRIYPPFDGSDTRIPVANDEETLLRFIQEKKCADIELLQDYLQTPFDVSFMKQLVS
jgi:hypothetical protein